MMDYADKTTLLPGFQVFLRQLRLSQLVQEGKPSIGPLGESQYESHSPVMLGKHPAPGPGTTLLMIRDRNKKAISLIRARIPELSGDRDGKTFSR
jgi:hypothetical protein